MGRGGEVRGHGYCWTKSCALSSSSWTTFSGSASFSTLVSTHPGLVRARWSRTDRQHCTTSDGGSRLFCSSRFRVSDPILDTICASSPNFSSCFILLYFGTTDSIISLSSEKLAPARHKSSIIFSTCAMCSALLALSNGLIDVSVFRRGVNALFFCLLLGSAPCCSSLVIYINNNHAQ